MAEKESQSMIYKLSHDFQHCYSLLIENTELWEKMPTYSARYRAESKLENWVAPQASFFAGDNYEGQGKKIPDVTTWSLGNLVFSPEALKAFRAPLSSAGEFLSILVGDEQYCLFNTLYVISDSAVDKNSAVERIDSGVHIGSDNISVDEAALDGRMVFKTNTDKLVHSYCTNTFKDLYDEHKFTGLVFEELSS